MDYYPGHVEQIRAYAARGREKIAEKSIDPVRNLPQHGVGNQVAYGEENHNMINIDQWIK